MAISLFYERSEHMTKRQWVIKFVMMHKWGFLCEFICITFMTVVGLTFPFLNGKIINVVFYDKDMPAFLNLCFIYAVIFFFNQIVVATTNNFMWSHLMTGFVFDIRRVIFQKILHMKGKELSGMYSGDMISRMNNDATDFMNLIFWSGLWGYSSILFVVFAVSFMFYYNVLLGIFTIVLVPVVFFTSKYFKKKSQLVNKKIQAERGKLSSYLFEIIKNMQEIKILNAGKNVRNFYLRKTTSINKMNVDSGRIIVTAERANSFIILIAQLSLFIICAYFIMNGQMQLGVFVAASGYFNMAVNNFVSINSKILDIGKQTVSIQRVVDILNEEEEDNMENVLPTQLQHGLIEFKNVIFGYSDEKHILNCINLRIDAGSTIGLVGKSGAGKTTMVNLLYSLYHVDSGELLIDGVNVNDYNLYSLRIQVGIVHQETILYDNTLRYNLSFSNKRDNDDLLLEAIKKAALYDVYLTLPEGLDTMLGADGQGLSGGQKQRLAIARILVKNPKILIFDEATSYLDDQNEALIRTVMNDMKKEKNRTLIIIAHRFSTIKNCDKIAVLSDGVIMGFDTHERLIEHNETYRSLFHDQYIVG